MKEILNPKETNTAFDINADNDFPEIFTEGGYKIYTLLNEKYQKDNNSLKAKYSYLFHFLDYEGYIML